MAKFDGTLGRRAPSNFAGAAREGLRTFMLARAHHSLTLDEYLDLEARSLDKHEFADGRVVAMAGGSARHNLISANLLAALHAAARGGPCRVLSSDQRVRTPDGLFTYADAVVACGSLALGPGQTLENPTLLVEVLSDATRAYDRGEKLARYQAIPGIRQVLLVEQDRVDVELWTRGPEGWSRVVLTAASASIPLDAPGPLPLADVYAGAFEL